MKKQGKDLFAILKNVQCVKCQAKGAVQYYGKYFPKGMGEAGIKSYEKYINAPYLSPAMGFGGTIPYECLNCEKVGLVDQSGLEGYELLFRTIDK